MKKLMLIMAAALVSLSACSKSAEEPAAQQQQNDGELVPININIEGEREDVYVVDEDQAARGVDLTGSAVGNKLKAVTLKDGEVDGVIYLYNPKGTQGNQYVNGLARIVKFQVKGNRISYRGTLGQTRLRGNSQLPFLKMDIYIGGHIKRQSIQPKGEADPRGGSVEYYHPNFCIKTEDGMDLSVFNPIFYSTFEDVKPGYNDRFANYYSTGHKFKLFGDFVSCRVRVGRNTVSSSKYNGFLVRGFGTEGMTIEAPTKNTFNRPSFRAVQLSSNRSADQSAFYRIPGNKVYHFKGGGSAPTLTPNVPNSQNDDAYTMYLFSNVEPKGGIRPAYNGNTDIFKPSQNYSPKYWGTDTAPYAPKQFNFGYGKLHNLLLVLM